MMCWGSASDVFGKTDEWECLGFLLLFALNAIAEGIERPLRGLRLVGESVHRIRLHPDDIAAFSNASRSARRS